MSLKATVSEPSIFVDPIEKMVEGAKNTGTERIELYTEAYAQNFKKNPEIAIAPYKQATLLANDLDIGINAGHDLNLENIAFLYKIFPIYWRFPLAML